MSLISGTRLGPYEIAAPIGAGGMGEVYRARDPRIGRDVAIKVLPRNFTENMDRLHRFEQEARAAGALNHPSLVTIYDLGAHDGAPYLVMELLEGESLRERLGSGTVTPRKAIEYGTQIAHGLAAAHEHGIIHRDLKPENVFITKDGRAKILDFGLAKLTADGGNGQSEGATAHRDTMPGTVMGTAGYMAPEQVRGQQVDHRADIFAFGAILYEMLSGARAFRGDSSADTMSAILKEDPPELSSDHHGVSPALDRIVHRCLEKSREERFHSAHDIAFALEAVSGSASTSANLAAIADAHPWRKKLPIFVAIGVALALAAAFLIGRSLRPGATRSSELLPRLKQLTYENGFEGQPSISPDGTSFVYVAESGPGNGDIFLRRVGGENPVNLTKESLEDDIQPAFSPDGQQIAFRSGPTPGGGVFVMGATGESLRRLTDFGFNPAWSPDGKSVLIATEGIIGPMNRTNVSRLWQIDVATGEKKELAISGDAVQPSISPAGRRIAYWGLPAGTGKRVLYTSNLEGGDAIALTDDDSFNWNPVWSHDGQYLYFSSNRSGTMNLWRIRLDESSGNALGVPEPVTMAGQWNGPASMSRDGKLIYVAQQTSSSIVRFPFDPKTLRLGVPVEIMGGSRDIWQATPSPDRAWLAVKTLDTQEDLFVMKPDGTGLRRLTNDRFKDREATWAADSRTLYFFSDRAGEYEVWRIKIDGSGLEQMTRSTADSPTQALAPDGKRMLLFYYASPVERSIAIADATRPVEQANLDWLPAIEKNLGFAPPRPTFSPDGKFLVGLSRSLSDFLPGIYVYSFESRKYEKLTDKGFPIAWLPDSRTILYADGNKIFAVDRDSKSVRPGFVIPKDHYGLELSADGQSFYALKSDGQSDIWMIEYAPPEARETSK